MLLVGNKNDVPLSQRQVLCRVGAWGAYLCFCTVNNYIIQACISVETERSPLISLMNKLLCICHGSRSDPRQVKTRRTRSASLSLKSVQRPAPT